MIEYVLQDADGNEINLATDSGFDVVAKESLTYSEDNFDWDQRITERSVLPGAVKLGTNRLESRSIQFTYDRAVGEDSSAYRVDENTLMMWLAKTEYLIDETNDLRVKATVLSHNPLYNPGGHKISGGGQFTLQLLDPYWETEIADIISDSLLAATAKTLTPNNEGYFTVPPVITLTHDSGVAVGTIKIYVDETRDGIEIEEDLFGTPGFEVAIIDCAEGTYIIEELDRRNKIVDGTGFFDLPIGVSSLICETDLATDIDVEWRERFFI